MTKEEDKLLKNAKKDMIMEYVPYVIILVFVIIIRIFIISPVRVNGTSMYPTLEDGDINLNYKLLKKIKGLERFQIVVINTDDDPIIKRIIGLPGETIKYEEVTLDSGDKSIALFVDGKRYNEEYLSDEALLSTCNGTYNLCEEAITLKENEYFVLGDNRLVSKDSRVIGPVLYDDISGVTKIRIFPFSKFGKIDK